MIYYFYFGAMALFISTLFVAYSLNNPGNELQRARVISGGFYITHTVLLIGVLFSLPYSSGSSYENSDDVRTKIEKDLGIGLNSSNDLTQTSHEFRLKQIVADQQADIEELKRVFEESRRMASPIIYFLLFLAPMLYYNLFKYMLKSEQLSGKGILTIAGDQK